MIVRIGVVRHGQEEPVVVKADRESRVDDVTKVLDLARGPHVLVDAAGSIRPLPTDGPLEGADLRDGDLLVAAVDVQVPVEWFLRVVDGPDEASVLELTGEHWLGRTSDLRLTDDEVSRRHAHLRVDGDEVVVTDAGSTNGTRVDGVRIADAQRVRSGARIGVGVSTLVLERRREASVAEASLVPDRDGGLLLNRVPSLRRPPDFGTVTMPPLLRTHGHRPISWLPSLLPVVFAAGIALVLDQMIFLLFALLGPITFGATLLSTRRADKLEARRDRTAYDEALASARAEVDAATQAELAWLLVSSPSAGEVADLVVRRELRLWERSPGDVDFLRLRVATGRREASVRVDGPGAAPAGIAEAPLTVDLPSAGVLGIAGERQRVLGLARALLTQVAGLHASDEVRLAFLSDRAREEDWGFLRWLPHTWVASELRLDVARDPKTCDDLTGRLLEVVRDRTAQRRVSPPVVVVMDGASRLRQRVDIAEVLADGPQVGVYAIVLDDEVRLLPEECRARVGLVGTDAVVEHLADGRTERGTAETLGPDRQTTVARALAPIRRVGRAEDTGQALPTAVTFFELLGARPTVDSTVQVWSQRRERSSAPVGRNAAGLESLDLVRSGPHALVGGSSRSGKSELIQTWVASLALHNRPENVAFLFVEYKGLSAFRVLRRLPHCVGTITNLTAELAMRALASLEAERKHRQRLFIDAEVADFDGYQVKARSNPDLEPMPRLIVVLDEFAELKQELPAFMDGLLSVARTGASLGLHMLIATQLVGRAVSPEIAGNADLRVSMRAARAEDSFAIIDDKAANDLPQAIRGRAYVRAGDRPIELFQTAWVGAPLHQDDGPLISAEPWPWHEDEVGGLTVVKSLDDVETELDHLVEVLVAASLRAGVRSPRRPFTEPLPLAIPLARLLGEGVGEDVDAFVAAGGPVVGVRDDVAAQDQPPYHLPLLTGHVSLVGSGQSGRTSALRTVVASWAAAMPPNRLHVHAIDGARQLNALRPLPHVGTVAGAEDPRATRLLFLLAAEIDRRLGWLERQGMGELKEAWQAPGTDDPVPWILLVVDRFEELAEATEHTAAGDALKKVLSHGQAAGVTVLAAGDESLAKSRWQAPFATRLTLRNTGGMDPTLVGLSSRVALADLAPGRCYESNGQSVVQLAFVGTDPAPARQNDALRALAAELSVRWAGRTGTAPIRLSDLPPEVPAAELPPATGPFGVVLGVGGDAAEPVELDAAELPLLVVGAPGTGRTDLLRRVAETWVAAGRPTYVVGTPTSPLVRSAPEGAVVVFEDGSVDWKDLLARADVCVVADDLHAQQLADDFVEAVEAEIPRCGFVAGMNGMSLVPATFKALVQSGGLLYLTPPHARDVEYFGVQVDPSLCASEPPGRAVLVTNRRRLAVQIGT